MGDERRPNSSGPLKKAAGEGERERGKLKIFFGYAAGVGKTYAMLDAARTAAKAGLDVAVGYVGPNTRPETLALLAGLELLPPLKVKRGGLVLNELDLDGALARSPQLLLVDELAHANPQGCRHAKRYMDVEELLNAGIDVYTTLNVQQLESLNDIVASITHVVVQERIPDRVFDEAFQVNLVDVEPDELILRLNQGESKAQRPGFFVRENLVALREIALRQTAIRVNRSLEGSKSGDYSGEHILVCLSPSPSNAKVIRTAARLAGAFHAEFTALLVETSATKELSGEYLEKLRANLKLAQQLGAKIATAYGEDVPYQISEYAKASGISKIVIGQSNNQWGVFHRQNLVVRLTQLATKIDVYVIPDNQPPYMGKDLRKPEIPFFRPGDMLRAALALAACSLAGFLFHLMGISETNIITLYILGALLVAKQTNGRLYGICYSVASVLVFNFLFIDPRFSFQATGTEYPITLLVMLAASLATSTLTIRIRNQAKTAAQRAWRTDVLLETSRKLQRAAGQDEIIKTGACQLIQLTGRAIVVYPAAGGVLGAPRVFRPEDGGDFQEAYISQEERAVADWVQKNDRPAGRSTDTFSGSSALYLPVSGREGLLAVVGVFLQRQPLEPFEHSLVMGLLGEIAIALEKDQLHERQKTISMEADREKLRANLLRTISHDLRTPLTSISGSASILLSNGNAMTPQGRDKLCQDIYDDSLWLISLVENLLSMTRIDGGKLGIKRQPELMEEIITEALLHISPKSSEHILTVSVKDSLLMADMDAQLMIQVIVNIVDNAVKYTPPGSRIAITAFAEGDRLITEIADDGGGLSEQDKKQIFEMFYTAHNPSGDNRRGLGLGLCLCKSIIEAHGGTIYARDNEPQGTVFGFSLQLEEVETDGESR